MKQAKELRALSEQEQEKRLEDIKKQLLKLSLPAATTGAGSEAGKISQLRKTLARIYTLQQEKKGKKTGKENAEKKGGKQ